MKPAPRLQISWQTLKCPRKNRLSIILSKPYATSSADVRPDCQRCLFIMANFFCCSATMDTQEYDGIDLLQPLEISKLWARLQASFKRLNGVSLRLSHILTNLAWMGGERFVPPLSLGGWLNMFQDYTFDNWEIFIARAMWNRRTCWRVPCCYLDPNLLGWYLANRRHTSLNRKHVLAFRRQLKYINLTGSIIGSAAIRAFSAGRIFMAQDCKISGQRARYP